MANRQIRSKQYVRKRLRRIGGYVGSVLIALLLIISGLIGLTHWSSVQINSFSMSASTESDLPKNEMKEMVSTIIDRNLWGIIGQDNIVLLPRSSIRSNLESISPRIRSVNTDITGLRSFTVNINTREPVGVVCARTDDKSQDEKDNCRLVDKNGFVYAQAEKSSSSSLILYTKTDISEVGGQLINKETFSVLQSFIGNLPELGLPPQRVRLQDKRDISIAVGNADNATTTATSSVDIRIDTSDNLKQTYTDLKTVIEKDAFVASSSKQATGTEKQTVSPFALEYIDLRFGNKVFYK